MFDFRYHALSLVAVFLALAIGILLGMTIVDPLGRDVRSSLRDDVVEARRSARDADDQLKRRDELIADVFPRLAAERLRGVRVALVASGDLPDGVEGPVREAVEVAGGTVDSVSVLEASEVPGDVAAALDGGAVRPSGDRSALRRLARRIGAAIARGRRDARVLQRALPDRFRGDYRGADAVVLYRAPAEQEEGEDARAAARASGRAAFEDQLVSAMDEVGAPVVGVEEFSTEPSTVPWYEQRELTSVDSVDLPAGRLALVYSLDGSRGTFGLKDTADRPLPELGPRG
ncbi:MAG: copper transporter [Actinomycetota bacterium]|nr:copper transporter [Actinomycetota bacterium]